MTQFSFEAVIERGSGHDPGGILFSLSFTPSLSSSVLSLFPAFSCGQKKVSYLKTCFGFVMIKQKCVWSKNKPLLKKDTWSVLLRDAKTLILHASVSSTISGCAAKTLQRDFKQNIDKI